MIVVGALCGPTCTPAVGRAGHSLTYVRRVFGSGAADARPPQNSRWIMLAAIPMAATVSRIDSKLSSRVRMSPLSLLARRPGKDETIVPARTLRTSTSVTARVRSGRLVTTGRRAAVHSQGATELSTIVLRRVAVVGHAKERWLFRARADRHDNGTREHPVSRCVSRLGELVASRRYDAQRQQEPSACNNPSRVSSKDAP